MNDYFLFLEEIGITEAQIREAMSRGVDYDPTEIKGIELRPSGIHGTGTFSTRCFALGEHIADGMKMGRWTTLGRFANHSLIPNMRAESAEGSMIFVADRAIRENEELTINYRSVKAAIEKGESDV